LTVKGGELEISSLRLPMPAGRATVDGQFVERDGEAIFLGAARKLRAGDALTVGVQARGAA
jgi:hypothetical protein